MFADIREPLILEWIQHHTSDGTFCRKSDSEKDSDINTPGNDFSWPSENEMKNIFKG